MDQDIPFFFNHFLHPLVVLAKMLADGLFGKVLNLEVNVGKFGVVFEGRIQMRSAYTNGGDISFLEDVQRGSCILISKEEAFMDAINFRELSRASPLELKHHFSLFFVARNADA